jgi:ActR/RegA family two-component response regulator
LEKAMKVLVIDDDISWLSWLQEHFDIIQNDPSGEADVALVAERFLCKPKKCRFIVTTCSQNVLGAIKARRMGASDYITKEYDAEKLRRKLS